MISGDIAIIIQFKLEDLLVIEGEIIFLIEDLELVGQLVSAYLLDIKEIHLLLVLADMETPPS